MRSNLLLVVTSIVGCALSQSSNSASITESVTLTASEIPSGEVTYNTNISPSPLSTEVTYTSDGSTRTRSASATSATSAIASASGNSTASILISSSTGAGSTILSGSIPPTTSTLNGTTSSNVTSTHSAARPTNTIPCNGYAEFCNRQYSNITHVAAHNSPFNVQNNLASNQALDVTYQLNDGVRMLQFQVHHVNDSMYLCHSSCDLLNAGLLVDYLTTVREWLDQNRYDVVTILMGNQNAVAPGNFTQPVIDSGLAEYAYVPPTVPMARDKWPTLGQMILSNKRVVFMLDYEANQDEIPWLLDEFSYMWETPFSPVDRDFPCTADRPPDQPRDVYDTRMSMANHNLNVDIALAGIKLLVPAYNLLNETNAVDGFGSVGWAVQNCTRDWNRPPNFLLVDYYNVGNFNGSVFQVAADANEVTYNRDSCCGIVNRNSGSGFTLSRGSLVLTLLVIGMLMI